MKAIHRPAVLERAKKDDDFAGKVREAGKADHSEYAEAKGKPRERHHSGKTAQFIEDQRARAPAQFACEGK